MRWPRCHCELVASGSEIPPSSLTAPASPLLSTCMSWQLKRGLMRPSLSGSAKKRFQCMASLDRTVQPELQPARDLQKQLTMPLHSRTAHQLLSIAEPTTKACLESLMTPHATAWFACAPLVRVLAPSESVAATRRNLGLKLRQEPYPLYGAVTRPALKDFMP